LDPEIINISQTRIVTKNRGDISVVPFGSTGTENYQGALTPLYNALHLRSGVFNRHMKKVVICEGITDFYFFSMLLRYSRKHRIKALDLIPGAGAGQLKDLISMAIAWSEKYLVLLDSDSAGKTASRRYRGFFGNQESENFFMYSTPQQEADVQLEDLLSQPDRQAMLEATEATHLKAAFPTLFFGPEDLRKSLFSSLDTQSVINLSVVWGRLKLLSDS
jgi:hypothetical protein